MLRWIVAKLEFALSILAFSIFLGAFVSLPDKLSGAHAESGGSNPINSVAMTLILASTCVLIYRDRASVMPLILRGSCLSGLMIWSLFSALWSVVPLLTLRRELSLATCILYAHYAVARMSMKTIVRRLAMTILITAIASTFVALAIPKIGVMTDLYQGSWNGVFPHKNVLGGVMVAGVNAFGWMFAQENRLRRRALYALIIAYFVFLMVMSESFTALIACFILGTIALALWARRLPPAARMWCYYLLLVCSAGIGALLTTSLTEVLATFGRDPSLTGRLPLWEILAKLIAHRPLLGYGYSAFWSIDNPYAQYVWSAVEWDAPEAHNGYIDLLLQVGVPGLALALWPLVAVVRGSFRSYCVAGAEWSSFAFTYAALIALTNFSESSLFNAGLTSVLLPACYLALQKHQLQVLVTRPARRPLAHSRVRFSARNPEPPIDAREHHGHTIG